jgi:hypothetical protein
LPREDVSTKASRGRSATTSQSGHTQEGGVLWVPISSKTRHPKSWFLASRINVALIETEKFRPFDVFQPTHSQKLPWHTRKRWLCSQKSLYYHW